MRLNIKQVLLFLIMFLAANAFTQNDEDKYKLYHKVVAIEIQNDSLPGYIVSLKKQLEEAKKNDDLYKIAESNLFLAKLYYKLNSYDIAIEYNLKAIEYFEIVKDTTYIIYSFQNISAMYGYIGNSDISIEYSNKILKLCEAIHDTVFMQGAYINLATSNTRLGNKDIAFKYYDKALAIAQNKEDDKGLVFIFNNIGTYYFREKDYKRAKLYFEKSLNAIKDKNANQNIAAIYSNIAETNYYLKEYKEALKNATKSIEYFENKNMVTDAGNSYQVLIKASAKLGQTDSIVAYLDAYLDIQQETVNKRKVEQAAKLKILYDINKYELEIEKLKTENELKESKLAAFKLKLYSVIIIALLALIIGIVIIFQNARIKKSYQKIVDENIKSFKIEEENIELKKVIEKEKVNKVEKGSIKEETDDELFLKIVSLLETEKLYKNPDFNLNILAKKLNTNRSYVSKAINLGVNKTFVEFINDYRITESKRLLCNKEKKQLTIEAIGREAGFNSRSTFFRVFKSITGVTPSFFASHIEDD